MGIHEIPTNELIRDYLESYMDMARCELAMLLPSYVSSKIQDRLDGNKSIVVVILHELSNREDVSLFDRREIVLGGFSV